MVTLNKTNTYYILNLTKRLSAFTKTIILSMLLIGAAIAQDGSVSGTITTEDGDVLPGVNVYLDGTNLGDVANPDGVYEITGIPAGNYTVIAEILGRETQRQPVTISATATETADFKMPVQPIKLQGIVVTETRGDEITERMSNLPTKVIRRNPARVTGELLREIPGVDAVRRGPIGLDPVIRGLRETEVGAYVDGTRYFPGGPARMDSPISHLDPSAISKINVVKGPYALTWGAGHLSAIQAEAQQVFVPGSGAFHGRLQTGYHTNLEAAEAIASVNGRSGNVSYWAHANWREGNNYEAGDGQEVPSSFRSREARGKIGFQLAPGSILTISGGYQDQDNVDYPGRLLDAEFFEVLNLNAKYNLARSEGILRSLEILAYVNDVDHKMNNNNKPTAQPNSNRTPPFPLDITVDTGSNVKGGRIAAELMPGGALKWEIGGDIYTVNRGALRNISRRDNGVQIFVNDIVWPDADITDAGLFAKAIYPVTNKVKLSGTVRSDFVSASVDTVSEFFQQNITTDLESNETNFSGALMLETLLDKHWLISIGVGSAVRTADATERYSDRFPSSKAQTSAEFVGNPQLEPERSTQADLWIEAAYDKFSFNANVFGRHLANYITLDSTNLSKKLPLSPSNVFRYINGEADFWGFEAAVHYRLATVLGVYANVAYLWGEDNTLDEPALGVAPLNVDIGARYQFPNERFFVEGILHLVSEQNRVAASRAETPTEGYTTIDLRAGVEALQNLEFHFGVINLTDKEYVNHLNAKNPFTGQQIPEPGLTVYGKVNLTF